MSQLPHDPSASPTLTQRLRAWIDEDPTNRKLHLGSAGTIAALLGLCLFLGTRPPEQITTVEQVKILTPDTETKSVALASGQSLFDVTDAAGMSHLEALELNMAAIEANTAWCDGRDTEAKRTTGMCRRVSVGGHPNMAPDGWREGQTVYYKVAASLASTAQ